jgi:toxin ParE1/3/4
VTRYVLGPRAQRDIDEIWDYSAQAWNAGQAEIYIRRIQRALVRLAEQPRLGRSCDDIRPGYRKFRTGSHFVFYRLIDDGIDVVRILHESMDCEEHL